MRGHLALGSINRRPYFRKAVPITTRGPNGILENGSYFAHSGPGFDLDHVGAIYSHGYRDGKSEQGKRRLLSRANVRGLIVVLSAASAFAWDVDVIKICLSLSLLAIGSALHFIAKGTLIRNIVLCKDGVYRIVRHPYYLANYLIDSSFCLLSGNGYLLLLYPFLFFWAYGPSLRKEEKWLASTYGDEYIQYSVEIPQVFPDAHSVKNWRSFLRGFSKSRITTRELARLMRFWAVAFFLMLMHDLGKEGLGELIFWAHPLDHDGLVYLVISMCLYFMSFLLVQRVRFRFDLPESNFGG